LPRSAPWSLRSREVVKLLERDKAWYEPRLKIVEDRIRGRLTELSNYLGDAEWLAASFSAGDLLMVSVLLRLSGSGLLDEYPNLSAYVVRGEARPAYKRAFAAQLAVFFTTQRHDRHHKEITGINRVKTAACTVD
jgi:glutathione S-transferase